jgi:two-component system sensor histidine kinase BaeS
MSRLTSLAARLFAATCLAFVAVGLAGLVLVRWSLTADSSPGERAGDVARVERVGAAFVQQLQAHGGDWSFVPADDAAWTALLDDRMARLDQQACGQPCTPAATPLLTRRIALLDDQGRVRAGHVPHPLLVAFASIDSFDHPLVLDGRRVGSLMLMQGDNPTDDLAVAFLIGQQGRLAILAALGALLAAAAAAVLAAHFRRPIRVLQEAARRMAGGDLAARANLRRGDELGALAASFDALAARLQALEEARRQWVADTSHELRTPLAVLQGQVEALQDGVRPATPEQFAVMHAQVGHLHQLVEDLHQLARFDAEPTLVRRERVDLRALLQQQLAAFDERLRCVPLAVAFETDGEAVVDGDPDRLRQVLTNLMENAIRHTDAGGCLELRLQQDGAFVRLLADDTAPGVPAALLPRLGERFFRVDASRQRRSGGAGLGLALCRRIVQAHGGTLAFAASPLGGLRVVLRLPRAGGATA